jgi:uncharacterized protein
VNFPASCSPEERHEVIDALRGFALAGVFLANLAYLSLYRMLPTETRAELPTAGFDTIASQLIGVLVDGKFITVFSLLFGLGFAMQLQRAQARGAGGIARYTRRLLVLLGIGVIHSHLLWWGDILLTYALAGLVLIPLRTLSDGALLIGGLLLTLVVPLLLSPLVNAWLPAMPPEGDQYARALRAFSSEDLSRTVGANAQLSVSMRIDNWSLVLSVCGRFLLGYWAGRRGLLQRPAEHRPLIFRIFAWSLALGLIQTLMYRVDSVRDALEQFSSATGVEVLRVLYGSTSLALGIAFATGFVLLFLQPVLQRGLRVFAAPGRMALTLYLSQSLIGVLLFYGIGFGVGPYQGVMPWLVAWAAAFALQIAASHAWLARFRYGPMEWLWRWMTDGVRPFLRKPALA